jgi:hypothetical protein
MLSIMSTEAKRAWDEYRERELAWLLPVLEGLGYALDEVQPHLAGERYLMQAVTTRSGRKLILLGKRVEDEKRVVIKATTDPNGIRELLHERLCRERLKDIKFAYRGFFSPEELLFVHTMGRVISIQAFIEQERSFLARPIEEQFTLALSAFKTQEGAHAATYEQERNIAKTFGLMRTTEYLARFKEFRISVAPVLTAPETDAALTEAESFLEENQGGIEQYEGFLTHTDFVPHNIRVVGEEIYLLDHSSLRFGNKYEGWARFVNFMTLYNPELAHALTEYVRVNRTPEESRALRLMRIYRLGEILSYYANTLPRSEGDLHALNEARIVFWTAVLKAVLRNEEVPRDVIETYTQKRDQLRSPEERLRQKDLH